MGFIQDDPFILTKLGRYVGIANQISDVVSTQFSGRRFDDVILFLRAVHVLDYRSSNAGLACTRRAHEDVG
jgi:hypothetical protein